MAVCSCLCHQKKILEPVCTTCQDHYGAKKGYVYYYKITANDSKGVTEGSEEKQ